MADDKLQPLPLDGVQPQATAPVQTEAVAPAATEPADEIEAWLRDHPETPEETPAEPVAAQPTATEPAPTATATTDPKPVEAKPATEAPTAAAPTTTEPAKPTFAADEKFALAEGAEWTRAQIVQGLQERHTLGAEAQAFHQLFGMNADAASKAWGPVLQRLKSEPQTIEFLDAFLTDKGLATYLESCAKFYREQNPQPAAQPTEQPQPAAAKDPRVDELAAWREQKLRDENMARINSELTAAQEKYPVLKSDPKLLRQVILTAQALHAANPQHGIPEAIAEMSGMLDAVQTARTAAAQPQPQPAAQPVPALVAGAGASPHSTRSQALPPPDPNADPVDQWMRDREKLGFTD